MKILGVQFFAFNRTNNQFADCFILIQEVKFSISEIYKICVSQDYSICSGINTRELIREEFESEGDEVLQAYLDAENIGYSFTDFPDKGSLGMNQVRFPRVGEKDFEQIVNNLGGRKILETQKRTPDFELNYTLLELKDLQKESLENKQKQETIAKLFESWDDYAINIDPSLDFGTYTDQYHKSIKNTIQNHIKSASGQIKQYRKNGDSKAAGIVLLNTGFYSLPHELLKEMVSHILKNNTKTIEFAFVLSQKMQTNGWDMYGVFQTDWIGNQPTELDGLNDALQEHIDQRMTEMMTCNNSVDTIDSQRPISFEINNKVFYWNPGQLKFPWEKK